MKAQIINGKWNYRVGKGKWKEVTVPYSDLPVGHSEFEKQFDLEYTSEKVFIKFDGITYHADVWFNGKHIGDMLPYSEYLFDVTGITREKDYLLHVEIEDITPSFGPSEGWENFSGIIRGVSVLYGAENRIDDVFFYSSLKNDYKDAEFTVETASVLERGEFEIKLCKDGRVVCSYKQAQGEKLTVGLENVKLWSPDSPELYDLEVSLIDDGQVVDTYTCRVGFRELSCDRHRFLLNGKHIFLKGVCKHEMFGDTGHCPTPEQMELDMRMIKECGCNFVRLVHYPHNKRVIELADELGLMVSEEPGLWWSDTAKPEVHDGSLEVLRRTIQRDKNHPSIVFWLAFNECKFTEQYLIDSVKVCRENDPTRLVSGANCMTLEDTVKYFNICGFDFYTMHPYDQTMARAFESAKALYDKPLVFTEWGGHFVYDNPKLLREFLAEMYAMYESASDEKALAGSLFWEWSELNDFNRGDAACVDGNLREGLVNMYREPNLIYKTFSDSLKKMGELPVGSGFWTNGDFEASGENIAPASNEDVFVELLDAVKADIKAHPRARMRRLVYGPRLDGVIGLSDVPHVIGDGTTLSFDTNKASDKITLYGLTGFTKGYPLSGEYGETAATLVIECEGGEIISFELKNGVDITTVFALNGSSRINPVTESSERIGIFGYNKNFEQYIMNKATFELGGRKDIRRISLSSANNGYSLLVYAISI